MKSFRLTLKILGAVFAVTALAGLMRAQQTADWMFAALNRKQGEAPVELDALKDFFVTKAEAYALLPPQYVCGPTQNDLAWSSDGQYLFVARQARNITPEMVASPDTPFFQGVPKLAFWSVKDGRVTGELPFQSEDGLFMLNFGWVNGIHSAFLETQQQIPAGPGFPEPVQRYIVSRVDVDGTAKVAFTADIPSWSPAQLDVRASPSEPRLFAGIVVPLDGEKVYAQHQSSIPNAEAAIIDMRTLSLTHVTAPSPSSRFSFDDKGDIFCITGAPHEHSISLVNPQNGEMKAASLPHEPRVQPSSPGFRLTPVQTLSERGSAKLRIPQLWIEGVQGGEDSAAMVGLNAYAYSLSPKLDAVAYANKEGTFVRRMVRLSLEDFKKLKDLARRRQIMMQAKRLGLAMSMYAADYDDHWPRGGQEFASQIGPYSSDPSIASGFHYNLNGGAMGQNPSQQQLGFIEGPGGRAIVWGDGHVTWQPNPG